MKKIVVILLLFTGLINAQTDKLQNYPRTTTGKTTDLILKCDSGGAVGANKSMKIADFIATYWGSYPTGSGTSGYVPLWDGTESQGNSVITQSSGNIIIGTGGPTVYGIESFLLSKNQNNITLSSVNNPNAGSNSAAGLAVLSDVANLLIASNSSTATPSGMTLPSSTSIASIGSLLVGPADNHPMMFYTDNLERARISATGNVGIGTTSPGFPLTIGNGAATIYNDEQLLISKNQNNLTLESINNPNTGNASEAGLSINSDVANLLITANSSTLSPSGLYLPSSITLGSAAGSFIFGTSDNHPMMVYSNGLERMRVSSAGNIGIGTISPVASAKLDITSTTQGLLPPRMTTTQMNAISSPASGLTIINTTQGDTIYWYDGNRWHGIGAAGGSTYSAGNGIKISSTTIYADTTKLWSTHGNSGTVAGTNFEGTKDSIDMVFDANGHERFRLKPDNNLVSNAFYGTNGVHAWMGIGTKTPMATVEIKDSINANTALQVTNTSHGANAYTAVIAYEGMYNTSYPVYAQMQCYGYGETSDGCTGCLQRNAIFSGGDGTNATMLYADGPGGLIVGVYEPWDTPAVFINKGLIAGQTFVSVNTKINNGYQFSVNGTSYLNGTANNIGTVTGGTLSCSGGATIIPPTTVTNSVSTGAITINGHSTYQETDSVSSNATAVTVSYSNIILGEIAKVEYWKTTATDAVLTFPTGTIVSAAQPGVSGQTLTLHSTTSGQFTIWIDRITNTKYKVTSAQNVP